MAVRWIRCALAAGVAIALAGCGASGGSDAGTNTTGTSASTTTEARRTTTTTVLPTTTTTAAPTTTTPPTTTAPPLSSPTWDQIKNAAIPAFCEHDATTLVDGKDVTLAPNEGFFELEPDQGPNYQGLVSGVPSNDAGPLTAVVAGCNAGGVGWPNLVLFFADGGRFYGASDLYEGVDWEGAGLSGPGRDGVYGIYLQDGVFGVLTSAEGPEDAACCPSADATLTMHAESGRIVIDSVEQDIGD